MLRRVLVVANRTLGGLELLDRARALLVEGPTRFHVLVPVPRAGETGSHAEAAAAARERLARELERLEQLGAEVSGEQVDLEPEEAVRAALGREAFDEVIVCTLPRGISRWLGRDLLGALGRELEVPLTHITAPAGWSERVRARAVRLTVYIGERDRYGHQPLYTEIVQRARAAGLAGATVLRGVEGFGASSVIHTSRLVTAAEDLPMVVILVDAPERIEAFLPELDELISEGLVVTEDVDVVKYVGRTTPPA